MLGKNSNSENLIKELIALEAIRANLKVRELYSVDQILRELINCVTDSAGLTSNDKDRHTKMLLDILKPPKSHSKLETSPKEHQYHVI